MKRLTPNDSHSEGDEFYRRLISNSLDVILLTDTEGKISFSTPQVFEVLGYDAGELIGKNVFQFIHPDDLQLAIESFQNEVNKSPVVKSIIIRLRRKDESLLWCKVRGHNLLDDNAIQRIAIYFHDHTAAKRASDALNESEQRFRMLIKNLQVGVLLQDAEGKVLTTNGVMEKLFRAKEHDVVGKKVSEFIPNVVNEQGKSLSIQERPTYLAIHRKASVKDFVVGVSHPARRNRKVWLLVNSEPVLDDDGNVKQIVSSFTDITERRKREKKMLSEKVCHQRQLNQATIDAQEKERMQIGKDLHDNIGQQLTTIKLYLDLARSSKDESCTQTMVNSAARALADAINDVRALSSSLVPSSLRDLGLIEAIEDLADVISTIHPVNVLFNHHNFKDHFLTENSKVAVFRIIQEQLNNIIKHSGSTEARIELHGSEKSINLQIRDDGRGFDLMKIKRGLGLSNIINRAELLGGTAEIHSIPGKGCTVTVSFPKTFAHREQLVLAKD